MSDIERDAEIRRLYFAEHWKKGTISTQLGVHHDVVERAIGHCGPQPASGPKPSVLDPYRPFVVETLQQYPKLRSTRLYDMLRDRGYPGSERTLRRYVADVRPTPKREAFLRTETLAGEQAQVDWGQRRWTDLCWGEHPVAMEYAPVRVKCRHCDATPVEMIAWADPHQRQTRRLQQQLAVQAASMPIMHVAALHGLDWSTVRRAEDAALQRWQQTRPAVRLRMVGVDEKYLGRRAKNRPEKFVTIVSNLETGEPLWIGPGRRQETLAGWLSSLSAAEKADIVLFAMDMHEPFANAVRADQALAHAAIVHDPFHVMKRAGEAIDELRRSVLFRAGPQLRALGRGKRWLVLRAWVRLSDGQRRELQRLLRANTKLAHAYQVKEQLRDVLTAPTWMDMIAGLGHVLRRTARRDNPPLRKLHDSLLRHVREIVALGEHHPPTGRIEALNNNWETLVRRGRGYRDLHSMLRRLRFMVANPLRTGRGLQRFLALGATPPFPVPIAA